MTGVDTNMLVYSHRMDSPHFTKAEYHITKLAEGPSWWAIPWPCIHEFLAVVTNPRLFPVPTPLAAALDQVDAWMESPMLRMIGEATGYWVGLKQIMSSGKGVGPMTHDARIVAICRQHGVRTIWSADRKFPRIPGIKIVNPLLEPDQAGSASPSGGVLDPSTGSGGPFANSILQANGTPAQMAEYNRAIAYLGRDAWMGPGSSVDYSTPGSYTPYRSRSL